MQRVLLIVLLFCSACGYQWQSLAERPTITVPFIAQDEEGSLTSEIIQALSSLKVAKVVSHGGEYTLKVCILEEKTEKIGFRVDPQKVDGKVRDNLLATEARKQIKANMSLYRGEELVFGPYKLFAHAEYDYVDGDSIQDLTFTNQAGSLVTVLPFSLGQLEPSESASLAAEVPLYKSLARKIVDALSLQL